MHGHVCRRWVVKELSRSLQSTNSIKVVFFFCWTADHRHGYWGNIEGDSANFTPWKGRSWVGAGSSGRLPVYTKRTCGCQSGRVSENAGHWDHKRKKRLLMDFNSRNTGTGVIEIEQVERFKWHIMWLFIYIVAALEVAHQGWRGTDDSYHDAMEAMDKRFYTRF